VECMASVLTRAIRRGRTISNGAGCLTVGAVRACLPFWHNTVIERVCNIHSLHTISSTGSDLSCRIWIGIIRDDRISVVTVLQRVLYFRAALALAQSRLSVYEIVWTLEWLFDETVYSQMRAVNLVQRLVTARRRALPRPASVGSARRRDEAWLEAQRWHLD